MKEVATPPLPAVPRISVVLPVRNEAAYIADSLAQLQRQDYPPDRVELLVCDGRSDDATREIVARLAGDDPRIRLLDNPGVRSSSGRNVGFRAARGEIVVVVDGHVRIESDGLFKELVRCFRESGAECLGRPQPLIAGAGAWAEAIVLARSSPLGHDPSSFIYREYEGFAPAASMGAAYRPEVFRRIGYVDESFDACEDLEFNTRADRAGLRCYTSPGLAIGYFSRESPRALFRQLYRYGFGRFKYVLRYPGRISLGQLMPPALVLYLLALPLLAWLPLRPALAGLVPLAIYSLGVLGGSMLLAARSRLALLPRLLVVFPTIHLAIGAGFLGSVLRAGRTTRPARAALPDEREASGG